MNINMNFMGGSGNKRISGDNTNRISESNASVDISGDNKAKVNTSNGSIEIGGDNKADVSASNGSIDIGGDNYADVTSGNGKLKIGGNNEGFVSCGNGKINVKKTNKGTIESGNGGAKVGSNKGIINTNNSEIEINDLCLVVSMKGGINNIIINSGNGISSIFSSNGSINIGGNTSIINGEVYIGGVKQSSGSGNSQSYIFTVNNRVVLELSMSDIKCFTSGGFNISRLNNNSYKVTYKDQIFELGGGKIRVKCDENASDGYDDSRSIDTKPEVFQLNSDNAKATEEAELRTIESRLTNSVVIVNEIEKEFKNMFINTRKINDLIDRLLSLNGMSFTSEYIDNKKLNSKLRLKLLVAFHADKFSRYNNQIFTDKSHKISSVITQL